MGREKGEIMINIVYFGKHFIKEYRNVSWEFLYNYLERLGVEYQPNERRWNLDNGAEIIVY